jgi:hypothetical protein
MSKLNIRQTIRDTAEKAPIIGVKLRASTELKGTVGEMLTRQQEKNETMRSELNKTLKDRSANGQGLVMNPQLAKSQFKKLLAGEDIARKLGKLNPNEKLSTSESKKIHTTNADKNASKAFGKYCKENLAGNRGAENLASHLAKKLDHSDSEHQTLGIGQDTVTKGPSPANKAAKGVGVGVAAAGAGVAGAGFAVAAGVVATGAAVVVGTVYAGAAGAALVGGAAGGVVGIVNDNASAPKFARKTFMGILNAAASIPTKGLTMKQAVIDGEAQYKANKANKAKYKANKAEYKKSADNQSNPSTKEYNDVGNTDEVPDPEYIYGSSDAASDVSSILQKPRLGWVPEATQQNSVGVNTTDNLSDVTDTDINHDEYHDALGGDIQDLTRLPENGAPSVTYTQSMLEDDVPDAPLLHSVHGHSDKSSKTSTILLDVSTNINNVRETPLGDPKKERKRDKFKRKARAFRAMFKKTPKNKENEQPSSDEQGNKIKSGLFDFLRRSNKNKAANKDLAPAPALSPALAKDLAPAPAPMSASVNPAITKLKDQLRIAELRLSIATTGGDLGDFTSAGLLNKDLDVSEQAYAYFVANPTPQGVNETDYLFNIVQDLLQNDPDYIKMNKSDYTPADIKDLKNDISSLKSEISALENPQAQAATSVPEAGEQNNAQNMANIDAADTIPTAPPLPTRKPKPPLPGQTESFDPRQAAKAAKAATPAS